MARTADNSEPRLATQAVNGPMPDVFNIQREKRFYSINEAADYYSVNPITVRRWIAEGLLPASRVGRSAIRIKAADLDKLARPIPTVRRSA